MSKTIMTEGKIVLQTYEDLVILNMPAPQNALPPDEAIRLGKRLIEMGTHINNLKDPEQLIEDEAILRRRGIPISLAAGNRVIQKEAAKSSQWDKKLRQMKVAIDPVKSTEYIHPPTIVMEKS